MIRFTFVPTLLLPEDLTEEPLLLVPELAPELFAAPIVRNGRQATVGYCPDIWQTWE